MQLNGSKILLRFMKHRIQKKKFILHEKAYFRDQRIFENISISKDFIFVISL